MSALGLLGYVMGVDQRTTIEVADEKNRLFFEYQFVSCLLQIVQSYQSTSKSRCHPETISIGFPRMAACIRI
jgi:hypothetical protein